MRVAVLVLVAFVVVYVGATAWSAHHHASEPAPDHAQRPNTPSLATFWWLVPPFLKVTGSDLSLGSETLALAPGSSQDVIVHAATQWYQPKRLLLVQLQNPAFGNSVGLNYPPIAPPQNGGAAPEPLSASQPRQVIVLPQGGGTITLTCSGAIACQIAL